MAGLGGSVRKLAVVARAIGRQPHLRSLVAAYLGQPRAVGGGPRFLADLFRLEALRGAARTEPVAVDLRAGENTIVISSSPDREDLQDLDRLWDALREGASILWIHERIERFDSLAALGRNHPEVTARALSEAVGGADRR